MSPVTTSPDGPIAAEATQETSHDRDATRLRPTVLCARIRTYFAGCAAAAGAPPLAGGAGGARRLLRALSDARADRPHGRRRAERAQHRRVRHDLAAGRLRGGSPVRSLHGAGVVGKNWGPLHYCAGSRGFRPGQPAVWGGG